MRVDNSRELDLEREIAEKRLSPEYLYDFLENSFTEVRKNYNDRKRAYKSKMKASNQEYIKTLNYFDEGLAATAKSGEIIKDALRNFNRPKYFEILAKANDPLIEFDKIEFDASKWSKESTERFSQLHSDWVELEDQAARANKALFLLIKGKTLNTIYSAVVFAISFVISNYVGNYLEARFVFIGEFWSKLLTAFLFYMAIDRLIDILKSKLVWNRINILYLDYKKMKEIDNSQQTIVNNNRI